MGYVDDIKAMELADDVKERLIAAHQAEVDPLKTERDSLKSKDRRSSVDTEITQLSDAGFKDAPAALAYARRVFLSPDAEEPGAVLLADHELGLSGDQATGATSKEDVTAAGVLRTFLSLLPKNNEGKLAIALSDQGVAAEEHGRPEDGDGDKDPDKRTAKHKESLGAALGRTIDRSSRSKRYGGGVVSAGGDA